MSMYALDKQSAVEADNLSKYLEKSGKYVGKFTRAEVLVSAKKGTHGIGFTFVDQSGQTAKFDVWTMQANMNKLSGFGLVQALMTCMSIKDLSTTQAEVDRYDYDQKKDVKVIADVFADLVGKPVGLVLQSVEYEKFKDNAPSGVYAWKLEPLIAFRASDSFTSSEIWGKATKPTKLDAVVSRLEDKPLKNKAVSRPEQGYSPYANSAPTPAPASSGFSDMDDDSIPF